MFYLLEILPHHNQDDFEEYPDLLQVEITDAPPGECKTRTISIGQFPTLEDAQKAISTKYGAIRHRRPNGQTFEPFTPNAVFVCKPGALIPLGRHYTANWLRSNLAEQIKAISGPTDIEGIAAQATSMLAAAHSAPHKNLTDIIRTIHAALQQTAA